MAMTPSLWGQQLQLQWQHRRLRINSYIAIVTRATMKAWQGATRTTTLAQQWQRCLRINDNKDAIVTRETIAIATMAKTPAHWCQQHHHNNYGTSLVMSNKGNNASLMTAKTPAHQWGQWCHHDDGEDPSINKHAYNGANSAALLQGCMQHRFLCICCCGVGGR